MTWTVTRNIKIHLNKSADPHWAIFMLDKQNKFVMNTIIYVGVQICSACVS